MRNKLFFLFFLFSFLFAEAQTHVGSHFLSHSPEPSGTALGGLGVATESDEYSQYWNPAKLPFLDKDWAVSLAYSKQSFSKTKTMYAVATKQIDDRMNMGLSVHYCGFRERQLKDHFGHSSGNLVPSELGLDFSLARKFSEQFSLGATLRYVRSEVLEAHDQAKLISAGAFAMDIGAFSKYPLGANNLNFGFMLANLGAPLHYGESISKYLPLTFRTGLNFGTGQSERFNCGVEFSKLLVPTIPPLEQINTISGAFSSFSGKLANYAVAFGMEYNLMNLFAFRGGLNFQNQSHSLSKVASMGFGFKKDQFKLDAAYTLPIGRYLGARNDLKIGLGFNF